MKNWKDYATDANTNQSRLRPPQPNTPNAPSVSGATSPKKSLKIWLGLNFFLASLCAMAFLYGIERTTIEHSGLIGLLQNTVLCLYLPPMIIAALVSGGSYLDDGFHICMAWLFYIFCALLVTNFVMATIFYCKHRQEENSRWRTNFFLSAAPVVLIVIAFLV